jgi:hypothetical protein
VPLEPSLRASQSVTFKVDQIWEVPSKKLKKLQINVKNPDLTHFFSFKGAGI